MIDLVFPKGNEERLANMAVKLGIQNLIFCYTMSNPLIKDLKKEVEKLSKESLKTEFAILATQKEAQKAKAITENIVAIGKPGVYEDKRIRYVIDFESGKREDFIHHRNSGLTQVFIGKAKRTDKIFLVNARQLLSKEKQVILGRMKQNNRFFKKYSPKVIVISGARTPLEMRSPKDLKEILNL